MMFAAVACAQVTAASLAKTVDAHYNRMQSLQARYTERYQGMGMDRSETGTLTLKKPGRMRWAYDSPVGKVFVLDGKSAVSYTPGDAQATRIPEKQLDDLRSPLRFLLGHTELAKELDGLSLTLVDGGMATLSGTPRGMAGKVKLLGLTVDETGMIHSMRIEDVDGAVTTFSFTGMKENVVVGDGEFVFVAPVGVVVVNGAAPI